MPPYGEIRGNWRALPAPAARQFALRPEPTGTTFEEGGWQVERSGGRKRGERCEEGVGTAWPYSPWRR
jgi:hypothetical protein